MQCGCPTANDLETARIKKLSSDSRLSASPRVSILTVGYQSQDFIEACFGSIYAFHDGLDLEVLFVDNGDGTTEALVRERFKQVRIVPSAGNVGFGAGNNRLAAHARGRYLVLLNPDARFIDDGISRLLEFAAAHPEASIWGGATLDAQLRPAVADNLRFPTLRTMAMGMFSLGQKAKPGTDRSCREVEVVSGGFLMIDRKAWDEASGFDESFFLYSEEVDLMYRLHKSGHKFLATDRAKVVHEVGGADSLSARRQMYKAIGAMHYIRKHWPSSQALLGGVLLWSDAMRRTLGGRLMAGRSPRMAKLSNAFAPIAYSPWKWWGGYR
jgi:GT2 family glycosyltransferase